MLKCTHTVCKFRLKCTHTDDVDLHCNSPCCKDRFWRLSLHWAPLTSVQANYDYDWYWIEFIYNKFNYLLTTILLWDIWKNKWKWKSINFFPRSKTPFFEDLTSCLKPRRDQICVYCVIHSVCINLENGFVCCQLPFCLWCFEYLEDVVTQFILNVRI